MANPESIIKLFGPLLKPIILNYFLRKELKSSHFFDDFQKKPKIVSQWLPMASNGTYIILDKTNGIVVTLRY